MDLMPKQVQEFGLMIKVEKKTVDDIILEILKIVLCRIQK